MRHIAMHKPHQPKARQQNERALQRLEERDRA
jgi:hypothetical protein